MSRPRARPSWVSPSVMPTRAMTPSSRSSEEGRLHMSKHVKIHDGLDEPTLVKGSDGRLHWDFGPDGRVPVLAGGDGTNPVAHPLAAPVVSGTEITVDVMLQQPTRITQFLMDITLQRFVLDRLFASAG